jgi:hypothetical protein
MPTKWADEKYARALREIGDLKDEMAQLNTQVSKLRHSQTEMLHALRLAYRSWATGKPIPGVDLCAVIRQAVATTDEPLDA